jgi:hypothetical protein
MTTYIIFQRPDRTEAGCVSKDSFHHHEMDTEGAPFKVVKEFEAADWNAAMQIYNDFYGFGPYVPMED